MTAPELEQRLGFIHRWVPGEGSAAATTLLLLHGTGGDENDLLPLGTMLLPGASVLSPRGKVLEQGMPRFFRRLAEGVFDLEDLRVRTDELARFAEEAPRAYGFDPERVVALGFSNGANIAASLLLRRPGLVRRAVLLRAMVPFEPGGAPDPATLAGTSVLLSAGRMDQLIPPAGTERLAALLRERGAEVQLEWQAAGHGLAQGDIVAARRWLERHGLGARIAG